jgi:hypothetical protein
LGFSIAAESAELIACPPGAGEPDDDDEQPAIARVAVNARPPSHARRRVIVIPSLHRGFTCGAAPKARVASFR